MSTLALIGSGEMGGTVARLAVAAGLDVVLSNSPGPQTLSGIVDQLGTRATAATVEGAARAGDWVVLAVPTCRRREDPGRSRRGQEVRDVQGRHRK